MQGKTRERWQELCEQAANEQDPIGFLRQPRRRRATEDFQRFNLKSCHAWHVVSVQNRSGGRTTSARVLKSQVGLLVGGLGFAVGALAFLAFRWEHRSRGQMKIGQGVRYQSKRRLEGGVDSSSSSLPTAVGTSSSDASRRLACRELSELTGPVIYVTLEALSPSTKRYRMQVATRVVLPFWLFAAFSNAVAGYFGVADHPPTIAGTAAHRRSPNVTYGICPL
jgi:hypothetical protein